MKRLLVVLSLAIMVISCKKDDVQDYFYVKTQTTDNVTNVTISSKGEVNSAVWGPGVSVLAASAHPDGKTVTATVRTDPAVTAFTLEVVSGQRMKVVEIQKSATELTVFNEF